MYTFLQDKLLSLLYLPKLAHGLYELFTMLEGFGRTQSVSKYHLVKEQKCDLRDKETFGVHPDK